jgi:hypothetical protein
MIIHIEQIALHECKTDIRPKRPAWIHVRMLGKFENYRSRKTSAPMMIIIRLIYFPAIAIHD